MHSDSAKIRDQTAPPPRVELTGRTRDELAQILADLGEPAPSRAMRVRQLWHWLYHRGVTDASKMSSLPADLRDALAHSCVVLRPEIIAYQCSSDGTRKWLLRVAPQREIEAVHIPEADRGALCISSQVGCTLTCSFCHTGTMPLVANLTTGQILGQILTARDQLGE
jgi:23S rRNA (adenine2503-C2)-methyltransferase